MAVYTQVPAEELAQFILRYDIGTLVAAKGIAEGVENSNYLVDTTKGRFILTLYEKRVRTEDLPYFLGMMSHLAERGVAVPRPIVDKQGQALQMLAGRPACLIEFLSGISVTAPSLALCHAVGVALGQMHKALADFTPTRANSLSLAGWQKLVAECAPHWAEMDPELATLVPDVLKDLSASWPSHLPQATIHADLFPDNVLEIEDRVTGIIDFYFACTDIRAYDLAVTHSAWCFSTDGKTYHADRAKALMAGYEDAHGLSAEERAAFPLLVQGAALRFTLTRAYDWIHTPAGALVTRKDPMAFARRLAFYRNASLADILGQ